MKRLLGLAAVACLAVTMGCAPASKTAVTVGHVTYDMKAQYHQAVAKEIVDYGKKMYGAKVIVLDGKGDSAETLKAVESLIAQKVKAISVHS
ncbi:MAG: hypothetical protein WCL50_01825, partial [Spirochaetota bacterium]